MEHVQICGSYSILLLGDSVDRHALHDICNLYKAPLAPLFDTAESQQLPLDDGWCQIGELVLAYVAIYGVDPSRHWTSIQWKDNGASDAAEARIQRVSVSPTCWSEHLVT